MTKKRIESEKKKLEKIARDAIAYCRAANPAMPEVSQSEVDAWVADILGLFKKVK